LEFATSNWRLQISKKNGNGPIQIFVIGFDKFEVTGKILKELRRVRKRGVIRLVDLLIVQKDQQGYVTSSMHATDLSVEERQSLGAVAGALIGLGAAGDESAAEEAKAAILASEDEEAALAEQAVDVTAS
jgi:hypothetical protein